MTWVHILAFIVAACWVFLVMEWDVETDYQDWKAGREIIHRKDFWERINKLWYPYFILSINLGLSLYLKGVNTWACIVLGLGITPFTMGVPYMLFFDGWFNKIRNMPYWGNGKREGKVDQSWWDDIWRSMSDTVEKILKISGSVISVFIYLYLLLCAQ